MLSCYTLCRNPSQALIGFRVNGLDYESSSATRWAWMHSLRCACFMRWLLGGGGGGVNHLHLACPFCGDVCFRSILLNHRCLQQLTARGFVAVAQWRPCKPCLGNSLGIEGQGPDMPSTISQTTAGLDVVICKEAWTLTRIMAQASTWTCSKIPTFGHCKPESFSNFGQSMALHLPFLASLVDAELRRS